MCTASAIFCGQHTGKLPWHGSRAEARYFFLAETARPDLSRSEIQTMKCEQLLALLNDYIDGDIKPGICAELEQHLAACNPCHVVVDTVRKTITLYKAGAPYDLPPGFHDRLHAELRARWKQSKPDLPSENKI